MRKTLSTFIAAIAAVLLVSGFVQHANVAVAGEIELVLGTGSTKGDVFAMGNGIAMAVVLNASGVKVYNYATKGGKDNIKRISKKKRAINLAVVTAKDLSKASKKQLGAISGLIALGKGKNEALLLIVRNKAPKGVSKDAYAAAIGQVLKAVKSGSGTKMIKKAWNGWSPSAADAAFKAAGVKVHKASMM